MNLHIKRLNINRALSSDLCSTSLAQDIFNNCSNDKKYAHARIETKKLSANPQPLYSNHGLSEICFDL